MTKKSVGAKIEQLNQNLEWFYGDDFKLEDAAKKYQEAAELAKDIEKELETLKNQIEVISKDFSIE
ncbi:exodeoxyribonuclease VII small subunit [Candidatus Saccharibacteria bacterium]|jgi:exonuclease VII small subunit|nr:exodeoxyribonuclease VII small subunit [Candidatus Saccharibacteria bacterium]MBB1536116.1 exodeoxyribonuclease VII small subunit [Candidatus Saccharibacteria bacterium]